MKHKDGECELQVFRSIDSGSVNGFIKDREKVRTLLSARIMLLHTSETHSFYSVDVFAGSHHSQEY